MRHVLVPLVLLPALLVAVPSAGAATRTEVTCLLPTQSGPVLQSRTFERPRSCVLVPRAADPRVEANKTTMRSIRWTRWGRSVAVGSGTVVRSDGSVERATIRLSSRFSCGGKAFYTRGRLVYRDRALQEKLTPKQFKIQACAG